MNVSVDLGQRDSAMPSAFEAYDDIAAYVDGKETRSRAITLARDVSWQLEQEYRRVDLRVCRVFMVPVSGREADEVFCGDFDSGWMEVDPRPLNAAQRANLIPMWKVEPRA